MRARSRSTPPARLTGDATYAAAAAEVKTALVDAGTLAFDAAGQIDR